jgi:hypothetical protein
MTPEEFKDKFGASPVAGASVKPGKPISDASSLHRGDAIYVFWNSSWWDAKVLAVEADGRVRIHYVGWSNSGDESVPLSRVRRK